MKEKLLISFSGGKTSAFMTQWILKNLSDKYQMKIVFANTGKEDEKTLEFIEKCSKFFLFECIWVEAITDMRFGYGVRAKVVDFNTASRNGEPFNDRNRKHGLPNSSNPSCTRELKKYAIKSYMRQIGWEKYFTAIGIRNDEIDRMNPNKKEERIIYPLISMIPTTKQDIINFWKLLPFNLDVKEHYGNCDCCWKKSFKKLITIARENPDKFKWWQEQEKLYESYIPETRKHNDKIKLPVRMYRGNKSVNDILEMAKSDTESFIDENFSTPNGCEETCEAF